MFYKRHYFNNILYTPWPFCISISLFNIVFFSLLISNKYYLVFDTEDKYILSGVLLVFSFFLDSIFCWCKEITYEAFSGKYTKKIRTALLYGFFLFLLSEAVLFGSIFWAYFDRIFNLSYTTGFLSVPTATEVIRWWREPLLATAILIGSGFTCNFSYYYFNVGKELALISEKQEIKSKEDLNSFDKFFNICTKWFETPKINRNGCNYYSTLEDLSFYKIEAYLCSICTIVLGLWFLYIQYYEYNHLSFTISDSVYASVFYTLTGFHGLHVLVGTIFLISQYYIKFKYVNKRTNSLTMAVLYWHFVDIIWIFLWFFIYFFNNYAYMI